MRRYLHHAVRFVRALGWPSGWRQWLRLLTCGLVIAAIVLAGLVFRYVEIGKYLILGYGVLALVLRIKSDTTCKMVLITLACIPVLSVRGDDELAATLSIYVFLLLGIGIVSMFVEHILSGKKYI